MMNNPTKKSKSDQPPEASPLCTSAVTNGVKVINLNILQIAYMNLELFLCWLLFSTKFLFLQLVVKKTELRSQAILQWAG